MRSRRTWPIVLAVAALAVLPTCRHLPGSAPVPFTAAAPATVSIPARVVIYGDSRPHAFLEVWRENRAEPRREIVRRIVEERPALIVHSGDLVKRGESEDEWATFDREMSAIRDAGIPFYPAIGNHELVGDRTRALLNYFARFPSLGGRRWYEERVGPLLLLVVDTNFDDLTTAERDGQTAWYAARLAAAEADASVRWVFVIGHAPPYTNAAMHEPSAAVREAFVAPALSRPKVRVFVSGHVHAYERFAVDGKTFVVAGGGGAPRMEVYPGRRLKDEFVGPAIRPFHYLLATVEANRVVVDVMMLDDATGAWSRGDGFTVE